MSLEYFYCYQTCSIFEITITYVVIIFQARLESAYSLNGGGRGGVEKVFENVLAIL